MKMLLLLPRLDLAAQIYAPWPIQQLVLLWVIYRVDSIPDFKNFASFTTNALKLPKQRSMKDFKGLNSALLTLIRQLCEVLDSPGLISSNRLQTNRFFPLSGDLLPLSLLELLSVEWLELERTPCASTQYETQTILTFYTPCICPAHTCVVSRELSTLQLQRVHPFVLSYDLLCPPGTLNSSLLIFTNT